MRSNLVTTMVDHNSFEYSKAKFRSLCNNGQLFLFLFRFIVSLVNTTCNSPWFRYNSSCYLLYNVSSVSPGHTWNDSRLICRRYGGDLVKLETENETALISGFFQDPKIKYNHYWIGKE